MPRPVIGKVTVAVVPPDIIGLPNWSVLLVVPVTVASLPLPLRSDHTVLPVVKELAEYWANNPDAVGIVADGTEENKMLIYCTVV